MTLSLDLSKAFDTVDWPTLRAVLVEFCVLDDIIHLVLFLRTEARYVFRVAGEDTSLRPGQGIRHKARL